MAKQTSASTPRFYVGPHDAVDVRCESGYVTVAYGEQAPVDVIGDLGETDWSTTAPGEGTKPAISTTPPKEH